MSYFTLRIFPLLSPSCFALSHYNHLGMYVATRRLLLSSRVWPVIRSCPILHLYTMTLIYIHTLRGYTQKYRVTLNKDLQTDEFTGTFLSTHIIYQIFHVLVDFQSCVVPNIINYQFFVAEKAHMHFGM